MAKETKEKKGLAFNLNLVRIIAKDKNGKIVFVDENKKDEAYERHDSVVLMQILQEFDTKKHTLRQYKTVLNLLEKVQEAWRKDATELEISLDEGTILKEICLNFFDEKKKEEEKKSISLFWGKTIVSILEQLGE